MNDRSSDRRGPPPNRNGNNNNNNNYDRQEREKYFEDVLKDQERNFDDQNRHAQNGDNNYGERYDNQLSSRNSQRGHGDVPNSRRINDDTIARRGNIDYGRNSRLSHADNDYLREQKGDNKYSKKPSRNEYSVDTDKNDYNDENFRQQQCDDRYSHCDRQSRRYDNENENDYQLNSNQKTFHDPRNPSNDHSNDYGIDTRSRCGKNFQSDKNDYDDKDTRYSKTDKNDKNLCQRENDYYQESTALRRRPNYHRSASEASNYEINHSSSNNGFGYGNQSIKSETFRERPDTGRYNNNLPKEVDQYSDNRGYDSRNSDKERRRYDDNDNKNDKNGYGNEVSTNGRSNYPSRNENPHSQYSDKNDYFPQRLSITDRRDNSDRTVDDKKYSNFGEERNERSFGGGSRAERNLPPKQIFKASAAPRRDNENLDRYTSRENFQKNSYHSFDYDDDDVFPRRQGYGNEKEKRDENVDRRRLPRVTSPEDDNYRSQADNTRNDKADNTRNDMNRNFDRNVYDGVDQSRNHSSYQNSDKIPPLSITRNGYGNGAGAAVRNDDDRYSNASTRSMNDYDLSSKNAVNSRSTKNEYNRAADNFEDSDYPTREGYRNAAADSDVNVSNNNVLSPDKKLPSKIIIDKFRPWTSGYNTSSSAADAAAGRTTDRYNNASPRSKNIYGPPSRNASANSDPKFFDNNFSRSIRGEMGDTTGGGYDKSSKNEVLAAERGSSGRQDNYSGSSSRGGRSLNSNHDQNYSNRAPPFPSSRGGFSSSAAARNDDDRYSNAPPRSRDDYDTSRNSQFSENSRSTRGGMGGGGYDRFSNNGVSGERGYSGRQDTYDGSSATSRGGRSSNFEERTNSRSYNYNQSSDAHDYGSNRRNERSSVKSSRGPQSYFSENSNGKTTTTAFNQTTNCNRSNPRATAPPPATPPFSTTALPGDNKNVEPSTTAIAATLSKESPATKTPAVNPKDDDDFWN